MLLKERTAMLVLAAAIAAPASAWAFAGVGGCSDLPEYYRALGTLQGGMESACNMSVDQARRMLSAYGGVPGRGRSRRRAEPHAIKCSGCDREGARSP